MKPNSASKNLKFVNIRMQCVAFYSIELYLSIQLYGKQSPPTREFVRGQNFMRPIAAGGDKKYTYL